jgi:hypothetical protein
MDCRSTLVMADDVLRPHNKIGSGDVEKGETVVAYRLSEPRRLRSMIIPAFVYHIVYVAYGIHRKLGNSRQYHHTLS